MCIRDSPYPFCPQKQFHSHGTTPQPGFPPCAFQALIRGLVNACKKLFWKRCGLCHDTVGYRHTVLIPNKCLYRVIALCIGRHERKDVRSISVCTSQRNLFLNNANQSIRCIIPVSYTHLIFPMEKNGDDYMVCYQSSSLTGWNYVVMTLSLIHI